LECKDDIVDVDTQEHTVGIEGANGACSGVKDCVILGFGKVSFKFISMWAWLCKT